MDIYPTRNVSGWGENAWSIRQWFRRARSGNWSPLTGIVESYELLLAGHHAWFVVFYSYEFQGNRYAGELRKYLGVLDNDSAAARIISHLPRNSHLNLKVDPDHPNISVAT
jgi:hypothetical protein